MHRLLATAVVLGTLAVSGAATRANTVVRQPAMDRGHVLQEPQGPPQGKGRSRREPHPMLMAARRKLEAAKQDLQKADRDFGGHRTAAVKSIDEALEHIRQAENYDKR